MNKLYAIFCFFISSLLFSSQQPSDFMKSLEYKALTKQWVDKFQQLEQLQDNQLQSMKMIKNPSMHGYVKGSLLQAIMLRKLAIESCTQEISFLTEQTKHTIVSVDSIACNKNDLDVSSGTTLSLSEDLSTCSNSDIESVSSMTKSLDVHSPKSRTSSTTTEETMSYASSVTAPVKFSKQSITNSDSNLISSITKFKAQFRGVLIREDLSQIQAKIRYKKNLENQNNQKLAQQIFDEAQDQKKKEQKKVGFKRQQACSREDYQEKQKNRALKLVQSNNSEDFVLNQAIQDEILASYIDSQSLSLDGLSVKDKKLLKPLQKSLKDELWSSHEYKNNQVIAQKLYPMVTQSLNKSGITHQSFSNWLVRNAVNSSCENFDMCLQDCGSRFDGPQIFEKIITPTFGKERFDQLKSLSEEKKLQFSDDQIGQIIEIEKQLLLSSIAVQYNNKLSHPYTFQVQNN